MIPGPVVEKVTSRLPLGPAVSVPFRSLRQVSWGLPDAHDADLFCAYSRASFIGELIIFVAMHAQASRRLSVSF